MDFVDKRTVIKQLDMTFSEAERPFVEQFARNRNCSIIGNKIVGSLKTLLDIHQLNKAKNKMIGKKLEIQSEDEDLNGLTGTVIMIAQTPGYLIVRLDLGQSLGGEIEISLEEAGFFNMK
jgi:hypothetical protein